MLILTFVFCLQCILFFRLLLLFLSSLLKFNNLIDLVWFSLYLSSLGFVEILQYLNVYLYQTWRFSRHCFFFQILLYSVFSLFLEL